MKRLYRLLGAVAVGAVIVTSAAASVAAHTFSKAQTQEITSIMHHYLVENPEVVVEALQAMQKKQEDKARSHALTAVAAHSAELFSNDANPSFGNHKGDVTLVEFLDYQCGHCRSMGTIISQVVKSDPHLRVVVKELPIFGGASSYAAKAAIASAKQGRFEVFHNALLAAKLPLTESNVIALAKDNGLDITRLKKDVDDDAVERQVKDNFSIARTLGVMATPTFVIGNVTGKRFDFVPGAVSAAALEQSIAKVRG